MNSDPPKIEADPNLAAEQARAQSTLVANLQNEAQLDTASIMARFGTRMALGGALNGPAATPAAMAPSPFGKS